MNKKRICLLLLAVLLLIGTVTGILLFIFRDKSKPWPDFLMPDIPMPEIAMPDVEPVTLPEGAQLLYFPIEKGLITAGYQNPAYLEKFGYPHYGLDITSAVKGDTYILSPGDGVVLGTEFCDNSLGYIAVIRHDNVYIPATGETISLIGRYYHMNALYIQEGDEIAQGVELGTINRSHQWYNHIHIELDTDLEYPFHTPQVAEVSSELLYRYPATGDSILEPVTVLVIREGQRVAVNPVARSATEKDQPRYGVIVGDK